MDESHRLVRTFACLGALTGAAAVIWMFSKRPIQSKRALSIAAVAARGGWRYAKSGPALFAAAGEKRQQLRTELAMESVEDVTKTLGNMKGVLMKVGQMASYVDAGMPQPLRASLARLQQSAPPMSPELTAKCVREELGGEPEEVFAQWDPVPIAAASIGQVHRAVGKDGRALAVKVQYPQVAEAMRADLDNASLLKRVFRTLYTGLDVDVVVDELRVRLGEELDYRREARNQMKFAELYAGHPTIRIPAVVEALSTERVLTQELVVGSRFEEVVQWSQDERDLAGETIYRFSFGSLYRHLMFNGDPHPGNYIFHGKGIVTFLDFGLVKEFTEPEVQAIAEAIKYMVFTPDADAFVATVKRAGFVAPDAVATPQHIVESFAPFYEIGLAPGRTTITPERASLLTRYMFDRSDPLSAYVTIPRAYVILQRINAGLFAVLGALHSTGEWQEIFREISPYLNGRPATSMGEAIAEWERQRVPVTV